MLALALFCAAFTAATHFYIFYLELLAYGASNFRRVFQIPPEHLPIVRAPFNNLAIYNLSSPPLAPPPPQAHTYGTASPANNAPR